jgi:hypothetical protein
LSTERLTANKAFTNKLWNAGKFVLQNLPSQTDVSAWEAIMDYKVSLSSLRGHRFFCCHVFYAYCRHCPVQLTEQILFFLQFERGVCFQATFTRMLGGKKIAMKHHVHCQISIVKLITSFNFRCQNFMFFTDMVTTSYDKFFFGDVGRETYDFIWSDFADWYIKSI